MITLPKIEIKAMKAKEIPLEKLKFPLIAQLKYDGVRLITKIKDDMPKFYTYNGNEVPLPKLRDKLLTAKLGNIMMDGEIVTQGGKVGTRPMVSGMINSAMHGGRINESILTYPVFDSMLLDHFNTRKCVEDYNDRYIYTTQYAKKAKIPITRNQMVSSIQEVQELSEHMYSDGFEGLILKPPLHPYRFSRSPHWVKIKETKTADLYCTGTTEGTGKYEGMIGALELEGVVEGHDITVKAGSGMNDNQRAATPYFYLYRTIEVKYNSIIQDQRTGEWSLFLPRFNGVRIDK